MEIKTNTLRGNVASVFGADGRDGLTPYVKNGNWWIGDENTGVRATGAKGEAGYTPQYGVDYMTSADKDEIKKYVDEQFAPWLATLNDIKDELQMLNEGGIE